jgi:hypothetical protein
MADNLYLTVKHVDLLFLFCLACVVHFVFYITCNSIELRYM